MPGGDPGVRVGGSFRDPGGSLFEVEGRLLRAVRSAHSEEMRAFLATGTAQQLLSAGALAATREVAPEELPAEAPGAMVLEHERLPFVSYPYEWPPEMLHAAAVATLDVAEAVVGDGFELKDATPDNILFRGPDPVFVDLLSFQRRMPRSVLWKAYGQFSRTFLLPLLAYRAYRLFPGDYFLRHRDGMEPADLYPLLGPLRRLLPPFLELVSLPVWLNRGADRQGEKLYQEHSAPSEARAAFIFRSMLAGARRQLARVAPLPAASAWLAYQSVNSYTPAELERKDRFCREALAEFRPARVLDVGCNTGHYSALAADSGARVVAIDSDPAVAGVFWREARDRKRDILPLVVNLARPTPAVGWRNEEGASFLRRSLGGFDCVMALAVLHHLMVTEGIPLASAVDLLAEITRDLALIEFVAPQDPMFRQLTRGRDPLYAGLTQAVFLDVCSKRFHLLRSVELQPGQRTLHLFRRR